jgi:hypothetical protein
MGDERAVQVDRLGNGAIEYIYLSGDGLYLKTKLGNSGTSATSGSASTGGTGFFDELGTVVDNSLSMATGGTPTANTGGGTSGSVTTSIPVYRLSGIIDLPNSETLRPTAPNRFVERFVASGEINFSFRPADLVNDTIFRMEFYDYIDRFDLRMSGKDWKDIAPTTRVSYVDLVPEFTGETVTDASNTGIILQKPYAKYLQGTGNGFISGADYRTL